MDEVDELGPWTLWNGIDVLFFGGTDEEHIVARVIEDEGEGTWMYTINPLLVLEGGFPSREAAQSAARDYLWAAQRRAERKIIFLFV